MEIKYENYVGTILYAICDGQVKIAMYMSDEFKWTIPCTQKEKNELPETALQRGIKEIFGVECTPCSHLKKETKKNAHTLRTTDYYIAKCNYQMLIPDDAMEEKVLDLQYFGPDEAQALKLDTRYTAIYLEALEMIISHRKELKKIA